MFDRSKIDFEVETVPLYHETLHEDYVKRMTQLDPDMRQLIRRKDTKQPLGSVGGGYKMLQYTVIVDDVEKALKASGLKLDNAVFETNVYKMGSQLELTARFHDHNTDIDGTGVVTPEFKFRTSHNSTWANNGMMGLWRSACYNTLPSGNKLAYVYGRHTKDFNMTAFAEKIRTAGEYIRGDGMGTMKRWFHTRLHREKAELLFSETLAKRIENVKRKNKPNQVILSQLMNTFDEETRMCHGKGLYQGKNTTEYGSLWTAYQAATHWSTFKDRRLLENTKSPDPQNIRVNREAAVRKMIKSPHWKEWENGWSPNTPNTWVSADNE